MNESKAEGFFDEAKGKLKQAFGEATGNEKVANEGATDEVKGHAEQTWGSVKDTAHDVTSPRTTEAETRSHETSNSFRDDVTNAAEHAKESIQHGLDNLRHKAND